jgi:hypothetical protein
MNRLIAVCLLLFLQSHAHAWNEGGHHLIVLIAYDLLPETTQRSVQELIDAHPEYEPNFRPPKSMTAPDQIARWRIGRIGSWSDYVRRTKHDRPDWHYEPTATLVIGDESQVEIAEPYP